MVDEASRGSWDILVVDHLPASAAARSSPSTATLALQDAGRPADPAMNPQRRAWLLAGSVCRLYRRAGRIGVTLLQIALRRRASSTLLGDR